jgi:hypothetical protein
MIVSFKELKSYYKNILNKYYKLSFLEEEKFEINKNKLSINSLSENIYFNNDIILKNKTKNNIDNKNDTDNKNNTDNKNDADNKNNADNKNDADNKNNADNKNDADNKNNANNKNDADNKNNADNKNDADNKNNADNKNDTDNKKKNKNTTINIDENNIENILNKKNNHIEKNNISNSVLKILSFYYNLNDIIIQKNSSKKYTIQHKINNNLEYFYYNNSQNIEINNYYKILYDNNNKNNQHFSVLIQIGNYSTFNKMEFYMKSFIELNTSIYYTIIEEECSDNNINKIKKLTPNCTILKTKNMGMDIGLFIINLMYFRDKNINPKYILKLHTKTDDRFRNNVLNNLCKNKETILKNLNLFNNNNNGMLTGTFIYNYHKNKSFYDNHMNYLHYLSKYIYNKELKINILEFAVGTFFYSRFDLFSILDIINLKFLYNKLNNLTTLDINWYKIFYNLHKLSDEEIILHYRTHPTNYGNNLIMQHKTKCLGMRDFMIEHSLERFLGYICKYNNLNIIEV